MGTHPIFESDFDCLTVFFLDGKISRGISEFSDHGRITGCWRGSTDKTRQS